MTTASISRVWTAVFAATRPWASAYERLCVQANGQAMAAPQPQPPEWLETDARSVDFFARARLHRLVDEADLGLVYTRGHRWMDRWITRDGPRWPEGQAFVAITFHYGAGLWSFADIARAGVRPAFVHASALLSPWSEWRVDEWLTWLRLSAIERLGKGRNLLVGGSAKAAEHWLVRGNPVVGLVDAPHYGRRRTFEVPVKRRSIHFASGLVELAVRCEVPVYLYTLALEAGTPRRRLRVAGPFEPRCADDMSEPVGRFLSRALDDDPAAWEYCCLPMDEAFRSQDKDDLRC